MKKQDIEISFEAIAKKKNIGDVIKLEKELKRLESETKKRLKGGNK